MVALLLLLLLLLLLRLLQKQLLLMLSLLWLLLQMPGQGSGQMGPHLLLAGRCFQQPAGRRNPAAAAAAVKSAAGLQANDWGDPAC